MIDKLKFKRVRVEFRILLRKHKVQKRVGIITILHEWRDRHVVVLLRSLRHLHISDLEGSNGRVSISEVSTSPVCLVDAGIRIKSDTLAAQASVRLGSVHVDRVVVAGVYCRVDIVVERNGFVQGVRSELTKSVGLGSLKEASAIESIVHSVRSEELELQVIR